MLIPIIMAIMIFGMTSVINYAQETPAPYATDEEISNSEEMKEVEKARQAIEEFGEKFRTKKTADSDKLEDSEEFKALVNDLNQKQEALYARMPGYKNQNESEDITQDKVQVEKKPEGTPTLQRSETPSAMTEDQIMQSKEYQDFVQAQTAFGEFTGDTSSQEYKTLEENFRQKQEAFYSLIPADQPPTESTPEESSTTETADEEKKDTPKETAPDQEKRETREVTPPEQSSVFEETPVAPTEPSLETQEALIPEESLSEEPVGIDTVSLENPQGNWLFKRIWWERAEERYERIRILVDAIWEQRNEFFKQRNQLDRNILDPFYINIGIGRGELQTILSEITDFLEQQREQQGELSEQERGLYETYITEEETLKQLKLDVDMITNLDQAIDDALGTFMNQINRVKNYESEAWKNFKEIAHILNDTRARELYYMIEGAARNIKTISIYLEQEFFTHFHKLIEDTKTRVARVQSQMDALKEKGVLFQKQAEQLEQEQINSEDQENEDEEEEAKPKPKLGWVDWIIGGASDVFSYIWSIIRMPYDMVFGK